VREKVSVLMPIAPRSVWLEQAVSSLLGQTYENWHLFAVLDGDCLSNRFVLEQPGLRGRVRLDVLPAGSGVANALNRGLATISTELVARFDSDDICEPDRLETQVAEMSARPELLVLGSSATVIDESGARLGVRNVPVGPEQVRRRLLWRNAMIHPSTLMRRESVIAAGGYDPRCVYAEDYELWLRLAAIGPLDNVSRPLIRYRQHNGQHSHPLKGRDEAHIIKVSRRRATGISRTSRAAADSRHLAWVTVQWMRLIERG
jgi:glycosyltransferase involved in cell wall biosynthesis